MTPRASLLSRWNRWDFQAKPLSLSAWFVQPILPHTQRGEGSGGRKHYEVLESNHQQRIRVGVQATTGLVGVLSTSTKRLLLEHLRSREERVLGVVFQAVPDAWLDACWAFATGIHIKNILSAALFRWRVLGVLVQNRSWSSGQHLETHGNMSHSFICNFHKLGRYCSELLLWFSHAPVLLWWCEHHADEQASSTVDYISFIFIIYHPWLFPT